MRSRIGCLLVASLAIGGCDDGSPSDDAFDVEVLDAALPDAALLDAEVPDAALPDAEPDAEADAMAPDEAFELAPDCRLIETLYTPTGATVQRVVYTYSDDGSGDWETTTWREPRNAPREYVLGRRFTHTEDGREQWERYGDDPFTLIDVTRETYNAAGQQIEWEIDTIATGETGRCVMQYESEDRTVAAGLYSAATTCFSGEVQMSAAAATFEEDRLVAIHTDLKLVDGPDLDGEPDLTYTVEYDDQIAVTRGTASFQLTEAGAVVSNALASATYRYTFPDATHAARLAWGRPLEVEVSQPGLRSRTVLEYDERGLFTESIEYRGPDLSDTAFRYAQTWECPDD